MILARSMLNRMIEQTRVLGVMGQRDRLILRVLFETRITVAELVRLRRYDISMKRNTLRVRGPRARTLKIDPTLCRIITLYSDATIGLLETGTERDVLFPYAFERPFTVRGVRALLDHYRRAARIDDACVQR